MARIASVLDQDFEDSEFNVPHDALLDSGHSVDVVGKEAGVEVKGKNGSTCEIDLSASDAAPSDYDALVIPGGFSPDHLRTDETVVAFTKKFVDSDKPVAAVCHAGSLLIEADAVREKKVTSWPSIKTDLINAGATWVDEPLVVDGHLITSRNPGDLDVFTTAILTALGDLAGAQKVAQHA